MGKKTSPLAVPIESVILITMIDEKEKYKAEE